MRIQCTELDAYLLIRQYDAKRNGRITYSEFLSLVLPATSLEVRKLAENRNGYLNYDVEYAFAKLLEREISYQTEVETGKKKILERHDFGARETFRIIDVDATSYVSREGIEWFMHTQGLKVDEADLDAIVRRLDHDGDEMLSFEEFSEAFMPVQPETQRRSRQHSPQRASPVRLIQEGPSRDASLLSPERYVNARAYQPRNLGPYGEQQFISAFYEQIKLDRAIEQAKQALLHQYDYELSSIYDLFDPQQIGHVTPQSFAIGLNRFEIQSNPEVIRLLIQHYSNGADTCSYPEFCELWLSADPELANTLKQRPRGIQRELMPSTKRAMQQLLQLHLEAEESAESIRQRLDRNPEFDVIKAFQDMDMDQNGFVSFEEFSSLLEFHGIEVNQRELAGLMLKYDKNRDGRISYQEFVEEIRPHSPTKF